MGLVSGSATRFLVAHHGKADNGSCFTFYLRSLTSCFTAREAPDAPIDGLLVRGRGGGFVEEEDAGEVVARIILHPPERGVDDRGRLDPEIVVRRAAVAGAEMEHAGIGRELLQRGVEFTLRGRKLDGMGQQVINAVPFEPRRIVPPARGTLRMQADGDVGPDPPDVRGVLLQMAADLFLLPSLDLRR